MFYEWVHYLRYILCVEVNSVVQLIAPPAAVSFTVINGPSNWVLFFRIINLSAVATNGRVEMPVVRRDITRNASITRLGWSDVCRQHTFQNQCRFPSSVFSRQTGQLNFAFTQKAVFGSQTKYFLQIICTWPPNTDTRGQLVDISETLFVLWKSSCIVNTYGDHSRPVDFKSKHCAPIRQ